MSYTALYRKFRPTTFEEVRGQDHIVTTLKKSIGWDRLSKIFPDKESCKMARSVGTNLTRLKRKKIDALIRHSEALTEIQVRLYLPEIIENYE